MGKPRQPDAFLSSLTLPASPAIGLSNTLLQPGESDASCVWIAESLPAARIYFELCLSSFGRVALHSILQTGYTPDTLH